MTTLEFACQHKSLWSWMVERLADFCWKVAGNPKLRVAQVDTRGSKSASGFEGLEDAYLVVL